MKKFSTAGFFVLFALFSSIHAFSQGIGIKSGLLIFSTTTGSLWFKNKNRWVELVDSANTIWTIKAIPVSAIFLLFDRRPIIGHRLLRPTPARLVS